MSSTASESEAETETPQPTKRAAYVIPSSSDDNESEIEVVRPKSLSFPGSPSAEGWGSGDEEPLEGGKDDWGSVIAATEDEEESGDRDSRGKEQEEDDWGSVIAATEDEEQEERDEDAEDMEQGADDWGSVVAASEDEEEPANTAGAKEEEGHTTTPQVVEDDSGSEFEEDVEAPATALPTPSDSETLPPSRRSRFLRCASRQFRAETARRQPSPPRVKGRRRGAQINHFTKEYLDLLNSEIRLAATRETYTTTERFQVRSGSYVLGSWWSKEEKQTFFNHLAVLGKDRLEQISKELGSKTVVECVAYLELLHKGLEESQNWVRSRGRDTVALNDIPAAVELSEDCINALDRQAELLEDRKRRDEERLEKRMWGGGWLLDSDMMQRISELYKSGDTDGIQDIAPEAELLHVANMLQLSEHVFMNGPGDANFREYAKAEEKPSIRYTAFQDYYHLIVGITERLVQTAIFMAESRLRSLEDNIFAAKPYVRTDDVHAAVDSLDMPRDAWKYWATLPRRMRLGVVPIKLEMNYKVPKTMDLDDVEKSLSRPKPKKNRRKFGSNSSTASSASQATGSVDGREPTEGVEEEPISDMESSFLVDDTEHEFEDSDVDSETTRRASAAQRRRKRKLQEKEEKEDRFLDVLDSRAAVATEKELWRIMGYNEETVLGPSRAASEDEGDDGYLTESSLEEEGMKAPRREARRERRIRDWRVQVEYKAPWELQKRTAQQWKADDYLSYQSQAEAGLEGPPPKRRKVDLDVQEDEEELEVEKDRAPVKTKVIKGKGASAVVPVTRRTRRTRQSTAPAGFVSTVDAVSDGEAAFDADTEVDDEEDADYEGESH
ncbi:hypothetical protein FN846DRAFT_953049 [Sphaerosporella brunnea]|uniref:Myb-like domain-containing protein n=1 Tax=Sphaerosporella brunnea TaxID=1250544 RepID=A0A5J5EUH4_9PEZI|nr:hypothetical protein FN846DRAFT_953049 [Sphaerosporella brunnea]